MFNQENPIGSFNERFQSIRQTVYNDLQNAGSIYCMNVQQYVKTCLASNLEIFSLSKIHALNIAKRFQSQQVSLLNNTITNAMYDIAGRTILMEFDLSVPVQSILSAKHLQEVKFENSEECINESLIARHCQILMATPISEEITIQYKQLTNKIQTLRKELVESQNILKETILRRAFTAFEFQVGQEFYTLNYSEDMSMLFWDRYELTEVTAKSYYVKQYCIVEHVVTGDIEPERFIWLHKPSKNSMAMFLSSRCACLTSMIRPKPTVSGISINSNVPVVKEDSDESDDIE